MAVLMRWAILCVALAGCGLDLFGESGGGNENLPNAGAGPWVRFASDDNTPADEPFVVFDRDAELYDPSALHGGAGLRIWMTRDAGQPDDQQIYYTEVADVHSVPPAAPVLALAADQAWEQGRVAAPSVIDLGGQHLVMFYEGGTTARAIGRADSTDDGAHWTKAAAPVLTDATSPGAGFTGDHWDLFVTRPAAAGLWHASSPDGNAFTLDAAPTVEARPTDDKAFDKAGVADPDLVIEHETTGATHWTLYYVGLDALPADGTMVFPSVGDFMSSDGTTWSRFGADKPQLAATATGPSVLHDPGHGLMLYAETKRGLRAIAAAHCP